MPKITQPEEACEEIRQFVEKKFKMLDHHIIVSIAKVDEDGIMNSIGFSLSSINGGTPVSIFKAIISNVTAQFNQLKNQYEIQPAVPIVKDKEDPPHV